MKNGLCKNCGSRDVYTGSAGKPRGSNASSAMVEHYVCTQCGCHEAFVEDAKSLDKIRKHWRRVES